MNRFAELLDRLAYEPRRNAKLRLMTEFFRTTPDPERGYALAAMTGALSFANAKPGLIRQLIAERTDPVLFALSYDYVGDLSETVALLWPSPLPEGEVDLRSKSGEGLQRLALRTPPHPPPAAATSPRKSGLPDLRYEMPNSGKPEFGRGEVKIGHNNPPPPSLAEVVEALSATLKPDLPHLLARWLDGLDEIGRWALLKLVTGNLRIGVSARLAKTAVARLGEIEPDAVEEVWHGLVPPYADLFAWVEGRAPRPEARDPAPFRPPMLAHALDEADFRTLDPAEFVAEWKWDGIRVQAVAGERDGRVVARLYSRTGEDVSGAFPDLARAMIDNPRFRGAIDGELLILRERRVQSFNVLQQRLNRKTVTPKLLVDFPAHVRAYDLLADGGDDLRALPFAERRARLETFVGGLDHARFDISPMVPFSSWHELAEARADPTAAGAGDDAGAVEGCMLKRRDSPYVPGRPKGLWFKWKRDPYLVDAVLLYAQRGHGKRASFYSDYTFGVWRDGEDGPELVPVGKAYFGFTDAELIEIDRFVRKHTINRFGPVREVEHDETTGLVLEVAFEGLQRSTRHKSGVAMRFPRISRIRWDKPAREADRIDLLERMLAQGEAKVDAEA